GRGTASRPRAPAPGRRPGWPASACSCRDRLSLAEPVEGHQPLAAPERLAEAIGEPLAEAGERARAAGLARDRGHAHVVDPAGDDPPERLEVVVDVHGEP